MPLGLSNTFNLFTLSLSAKDQQKYELVLHLIGRMTLNISLVYPIAWNNLHSLKECPPSPAQREHSEYPQPLHLPSPPEQQTIHTEGDPGPIRTQVSVRTVSSGRMSRVVRRQRPFPEFQSTLKGNLEERRGCNSPSLFRSNSIIAISMDILL